MDKTIKRIGVLTSGGDAPGMNAAIRAVIRAASRENIECIGIKRGYNGLIQGDIKPLKFEDSGDLSRKGGTFLYTARSEEFNTAEGVQKAFNNCKMFGLDGVIAIGGDGTFRGLRDLGNAGVPVVGIPATIDNDIACTDYTLGFDTACNTALDAIDRLRDTMKSHERCSVVEVMGRRAGNMALYVGFGCGATSVLIPEMKGNFDVDVIEPIRRARLNGRTHFTIVVAEGYGSANDVAERIQTTLALDARVTILGHIQRGGSPSAKDRTEGAYMGYYAVKTLLEGRRNRLICNKKGEYTDIDISEGLAMKKEPLETEYDILKILSGI
ncbi:6-phosphofructokinase [Clostridiaceae bacterium OttesenSCG-928-D20]|nr:6-phosphofructokinase [Clostridiaceae bacterium OttesenSCG-928-D20]